jgi:hypothetical protein
MPSLQRLYPKPGRIHDEAFVELVKFRRIGEIRIGEIEIREIREIRGQTGLAPLFSPE